MFFWFKRKTGDASAAADRTPTTCNVRVADEGDGAGPNFPVPRDAFLLSAALAQGIAYPHNCRVGTCGSCKTRLVSGKIKPMIDFALSPLTAEELRAGYVLACQSKVRSDLVIEVPLSNTARPPLPPVETRRATVVSANRLPGDVLWLRLALDAPLRFEAGQFADLSIDGFDATRSYSFCDRPEAGGNGEVSFLIKRLPGGRFSERLFAQGETGLRMHLHGPHGLMGAIDPDADALCVAGGTGLAPMLSILADRLQRSTRSRYMLLFGVRSLHDHFADAMLTRLERESNGRLQVQVVLADEPAGSSWAGARGLVTEHLNESHVSRLPARAAFLCGAQGMVNAARSQLLAFGLPPDAIHADAFAPSGTAASVSPAPVAPAMAPHP